MDYTWIKRDCRLERNIVSYYVKEDKENGTWSVVDEKGKVISKDHRIRREAIRSMGDLNKKASKAPAPTEDEDDKNDEEE